MHFPDKNVIIKIGLFFPLKKAYILVLLSLHYLTLRFNWPAESLRTGTMRLWYPSSKCVISVGCLGVGVFHCKAKSNGAFCVGDLPGSVANKDCQFLKAEKLLPSHQKEFSSIQFPQAAALYTQALKLLTCSFHWPPKHLWLGEIRHFRWLQPLGLSYFKKQSSPAGLQSYLLEISFI